jgi:putative transposase
MSGPASATLCFCTHERARHFTAADHVSLTYEQILRAAGEQCFVVTAYCFMPDHVHPLVEGLYNESDLRVLLARARQYSAFYFKKHHGRRLWQRYGYERVVRGSEDTFAVARYILENPVRAGIVERIEDYPFIGSSVYPLSALIESVYAARSADARDPWSG